MDEVHYLADRFRGAVWEEVIIGLAESIQLVALSATVSNAEEFGDWLSEVRGEMAVVVSERRPVPLFQHVLVGKRLLRPVRRRGADRGGAAQPGQRGGQPGPGQGQQGGGPARPGRLPPAAGRGGKGKRTVAYGSGAYGGAAHRSRTEGGAGRPRSLAVASRADLVTALDAEGLLPAIVFIFSRVGCDAAVGQLLGSGLRLTSAEERSVLAGIADRHVAGLSAADLRALDYDKFVEALQRGIAAHHAGMLPAFKEAVEEAYVKGLVKVVFATETLALGINMPARSVVLEKLVKYNGETHADITPGEYTQLTGRAGRRGIDVEGHAVVVWQPGLDPRAVAGLASRRTYPLKCSFAPTYNMAANLVGAVGRDRARSLLEQSFAQFQTDRSVVGLSRSLARNTEAIAELLGRGGLRPRRLRGVRPVAGRDRRRSRPRRAGERSADRRAEATQVLLTLMPGDIIRVPSGKNQGWAVVIDPDTRTGDRDNPRPLVLTEDRHVRRLSLVDFPTPPAVAGRMRVPKQFNPKEPASRRNLGAAFRSKLAEIDLNPQRHRPGRISGEAADQIDDLRDRLRRTSLPQLPRP